MEGLKMIGGGGDFCLGGLKKLLIALIDEAGDFTANLDTGLGKETRAAVVVALNGRGDTHLLEEDAVLGAGSFQDVKAVTTKPVHSFFVSAFLC
jgi:hypothetical protein